MRFLTAQVPFTRSCAVRNRTYDTIDLHSAFIQPEDIFVFRVTVPKHASQSASAEAIHSENLDTEWAPLPGDYLDVPDSLPQIVWENVDQRLLAHV